MKKVIKLLIISILHLFYLQQINAENFRETPLIDSLKTLLKSNNHSKLEIHSELIFEYTSISMDSAEAYVVIVLEELRNIEDKDRIAGAYNEVGHYLYRKGMTDSARSYYFKSIQLLDVNNKSDKENIARAYNLIGVSYFEDGDFKRAKEFYQKSLKLYEELNQKQMIASSLNNLGNLYHRVGNYDSAIFYHNKSLLLKEQIGDKRSIAFSLANIGNIFLELPDLKQAEEYYLKALEVFEDINHLEGKHYILSNLSLISYTREEYTKSLENSLTALKVANEIGDKASIGNTYSDIGRIYFAMGEYIKAIEHFNYGIEVLQKYGPKRDLPYTYSYLGNVYLKKKEYKKAVEYFMKNIQISKEMQDVNNLLDSYLGASEGYSGLNDAKSTFFYFKEYKSLRDSLHEKSVADKVEELQTKYETEKKEYEIEMLNEENKVKEAELNSARLKTLILVIGVLIVLLVSIILFRISKLKQKQKLLGVEQKLLRTQMNPHFIFNSVSSIQNYIVNNEPLEACEYLSDFAKLMRYILENSRDDYISLEDEIETLEKYFEMHKLSSNQDVSFNVFADEGLEKEEIAVPPMIAQPFVENAIVHGIKHKPDGGFVHVSFKSLDNEKLEVIIEDNGIGRKASANKSQEKHKSLALEITRERLAIINSSSRIKAKCQIVDLYNEDDKPAGTKVVLTLPLKYL